MGPITALFDSNILIDYLHGLPEADAELGRYHARAISIITWMEVMAGVKPSESPAIQGFLATFKRLELTDEIAEAAVIARRDLRMKLPDAVILATSKTYGFLLVTRNSRDFPSTDPLVRIPYLI